MDTIREIGDGQTLRGRLLLNGEFHLGDIRDRQVIAQTVDGLSNERRHQMTHQVRRAKKGLLQSVTPGQYLVLNDLIELRPLLGRQRIQKSPRRLLQILDALRQDDAGRGRFADRIPERLRGHHGGRTVFESAVDGAGAGPFVERNVQRGRAGVARRLRQRLLQVPQALATESQIAQTIRESPLQETVKLLHGRQRILGQTLASEGGKVIDEDAQQTA